MPDKRRRGGPLFPEQCWVPVKVDALSPRRPALGTLERGADGIWDKDQFRCEGVYKLTDNGPAWSLVTAQVADVDSDVGPFRWPRRTPPRPSRAGASEVPAHIEPDRFHHHRWPAPMTNWRSTSAWILCAWSASAAPSARRVDGSVLS
jgi:hypothetical protein